MRSVSAWYVAAFLVFSVACSSDDNASASTAGGQGVAGEGAGGSGGAQTGEAGGGQFGEMGVAGTAGMPAGLCDPVVFDEAPPTLAETGLYDEEGQLSDGIQPFQPEFALWSDGAEKRRYIKLPGRCQIDASDMDHWQAPVGTSVWKEFVRDGRRVETRLIHRRETGIGGWIFAAYAWNEAETEAELVLEGRDDVLGTNHDIPSEAQCLQCHGTLPERLLGFSALQLAHEKDGVTLTQLIDTGRLSVSPAEQPSMPGDAVERKALGYLHANCGNCHNSHFTAVNLRLRVLASEHNIQDTELYQTTVNVATTTYACDDCDRIEPGDPGSSAVVERMGSQAIPASPDDPAIPVRQPTMPPVGVEVPDEAGRQIVADWIRSL